MTLQRRQLLAMGALGALGTLDVMSPGGAAWAQGAAALPTLEPAALPHAQSFLIRSRHTGQHYRIWLGLPDPREGGAPAAGYPALLALDGQATFALMEPSRPRPLLRDTQAVQATPAASAASAARPPGPGPGQRPGGGRGRRSPGLVVGIGYASGDPVDLDARALDYTPPTRCNPCDKLSPRHGGADRFLDFIEQELLPVLGRMFPLDPSRRTLFGHSYGGLCTLHTLLSRPALFSRYWAASPSVWFDDAAILKTLPERLQALRPRLEALGPRRLHLSVGGLEQHDPSLDEVRNRHLAERRMIDNLREVAAQLRTGWPGLALEWEERPGFDHGDMLRAGCAAAVGYAFGD